MALFWVELTRWWVDWNRCSEFSKWQLLKLPSSQLQRFRHARQHFFHQEEGIGSNEQRWLVTAIHQIKSVRQCYLHGSSNAQAKAERSWDILVHGMKLEELDCCKLLLILPKISSLTVLCSHPNQLTDLTSCIFRDLFCLWKAATLWCLKVTRSLHVDRCFMFRTFLSEVTFRTFTLPELLRFSNGRNEEIHN